MALLSCGLSVFGESQRFLRGKSFSIVLLIIKDFVPRKAIKTQLKQNAQIPMAPGEGVRERRQYLNQNPGHAPK